MLKQYGNILLFRDEEYYQGWRDFDDVGVTLTDGKDSAIREAAESWKKASVRYPTFSRGM